MRLTYSSHRSSMLWNTRLGRYVIEFEDKNLREGIIGETRFLDTYIPNVCFQYNMYNFLFVWFVHLFTCGVVTETEDRIVTSH